MTDVVREIRQIVAAHRPGDALEAEHLQLACEWLASTDDVVRRQKDPTLPRMHLVVYLVVLHPDRDRVLLGEHRRSGLWLPPGGHVDPGEHPAETAARECREELGIDAQLTPGVAQPAFLTVTDTVVDQLTGERPHTDVSVWYLLDCPVPQGIRADPREFGTVRWWSPAEIREAMGRDSREQAAFEPHLLRMLHAIEPYLTASSAV